MEDDQSFHEPRERSQVRRVVQDGSRDRPSSRIVSLLGLILVVAALVLAKDVLVLVAFGALLAFLLGPLLVRIQRLGLPRVPAVIAVMGLALLVTIGAGLLVAGEVNRFVDRLPAYQETLRDKIRTVKTKIGGPLQKASQTVNDLARESAPSRPVEGSAKVEPETAPPTVVTVRDESPAPWDALIKPAGQIAAILGSIAVVALLAAIFLIQKEDIRNRLLRLAGGGHLYVTTRAFDEASGKVSRYLLMTSVVNGTLGVFVGLGLFFIGVPNAFLWGLLFALLRFIPYVGPWLGSALPLLTSLAVSESWTPPLLTIGLILVIELVTANVIEPWIYGTRTGVSPGALIVAAIFWTWVWGVPGLFLATPLTVCLAVMGKYVRGLRFLHVALGDEPVLSVPARLYQRLLARDADEAWDLVEKELAERTQLDVFDETLIPALGMAERDRDEGALDAHAFDRVAQSMLAIVDLMDDAPKKAPSRESTGGAEAETAASTPQPRPMLPMICLGAFDEADHVVAVIAAGLMRETGFASQVVPASTLTGEVVSIARDEDARVVLISNVPPSGFTQIRYLCKRLASALDEVEIIVGVWGSESECERARSRLPRLETLRVVRTLGEAVEQARHLRESMILKLPSGKRSSHVGLRTPDPAV